MESRTVNSKRNIIAGLFSSLCVPIFTFFVKTAIARYFNEEYLGLTGLFASIVQVLNVAELGFSSAIVVNLYRPLEEGDTKTVRAILAYYRKAYWIIGSLIMTAGLVIMPFLQYFIKSADGIKENVYVLFFLYLISTAFSFYLFAYKEALFNAVQRFDITKKIFTAVFIAKNVLQLLALAVFQSFYLYGAVLVLNTIIYSFFLQVVSQKMYPEYYPEGRIDCGIKKAVKEQIAGLSIGKALEVTRNSLDNIILTLYLGLAIEGIYNNYYYIYSTVISVMWIIINAIQASVGNSIVSETKTKNYRDMVKFEFLFNIVITICSVYLISLYQPFMEIWMGKAMLFDNFQMFLFVIYFYVMAINGVRNAYYCAIGLWWKGKWISLSEAIANLILNIILGKYLGVTGILVATIITMTLFNYICNTNLLFKEYFMGGRHLFYADRIIYTFITMSLCAVSFYLCSQIECTGILGLFFKFLICSTILLVLMPLLFLLVCRERTKMSISYILSIIKLR